MQPLTDNSFETILLVEDAPDFQLMIRAALDKHCELSVASTIEEARDLVARQDFQLLVLDVNLPDGNGFDFCEELRGMDRTRQLPVIFLTARGELEDKLKGFALGADDYIVKPFEPLELRARVEAKLARERQKPRSEDTLIRGTIELDLPILRAYLVEGGKKTDTSLTPIEFKILYHLARHEGQVISREQLLATVWGQDTHVFDRATDKHVSSLRQKLGAAASYIETVARVGYRFTLHPKT